MRLAEVTSYNLKSKTILNESWQQLTESQRIYIGRWEKNVWPLMEQVTRLYEAELTANQINTVFANAETVAGKDGGNLTALGKAGKVTSEVSGKMKAEIDKLLTAAQNSGPVKNFDEKFEKLKAQLKTKLEGNPMGTKIVQGVEKMGQFAKDNPGKSAFIIGATTSVLAFASGGIASGAAIGFFLKLANNTIKGDKLSTAVGKSVKGAAIGAVAGALGDAIKDILPGEVTDTLINSQSGAIEVDGLEAMDATSLTDLDADSAKELIQTRGALAEILRPGSGLDKEAMLMAQDELTKVDQKIFALAGEDGGNLNQAIDKMQDQFDIKGVDTKITTYGDEVVDADGEGTGEIETTVDAEIGAEQLNANGINSADYPDNEWVTDNNKTLLDAGLTQEQIDELQRVQGFKRAVAQNDFLGINISAEQSLRVGDNIEVDGVPDEVKVGQTFQTKTETVLDDGTKFRGLNSISIEGEDANGNIVYKIKSTVTMPNSMTDSLSDALGKLGDTNPELADKIWQDVLTGGSDGSVETTIDNTMQNAAQAAAAVGIGAALAKSELKKPEGDEAEPDAKKEESIDYAETYLHLFEEYKQQQLDELGVKDIAKKGAKAVGGAVGKGAKAVGGAVGKGLDKAGAVAGAGVGKVVKGVKDVGRQVGRKVTKEKLAKLHKKAGSPTDTASIVNILASAGLSDEQISSIGQESKVTLPAPTTPKAKADAPADGDAKTDAPAQAGGGAPAQAGKPAPTKDAPKDGPGLANRMAGVKKQGHTWKGGQWVNDETGKIGSTAKLGNPLVTKLAQDIKAGGPDAVKQITKIIGTDVKQAPVKKPVSKAPTKPAPKTTVKPTKQMAKNIPPVKKPTVQGTTTLQSKSKNPKA